jgi:hypothetical protein
MKKYLVGAMLVGILGLGACATRASGVVPMSISAMEYANLSCSQTRTALDGAREREITLSKQQNNAATMDAVGVFLLAVPASSLFGGNKEGELARAKGEVRALEGALQSNCAAAPARAQ